MRIFGTILYALGTLFFLFYTGLAFALPAEFATHEVVEAALFAALFAVWLWDRFEPIDARYQFTLGAVAFTWAAVWPSYSLITAVFGALAALNIILAVFAWTTHRDVTRANEAERVLLDRLIAGLDEAGQDTTALRERRNTLG